MRACQPLAPMAMTMPTATTCHPLPLMTRRGEPAHAGRTASYMQTTTMAVWVSIIAQPNDVHPP
jgi:hypothetical protein